MFDRLSSRSVYGHFLHPPTSFVPKWPWRWILQLRLPNTFGRKFSA
jgi:hypothetical protein